MPQKQTPKNRFNIEGWRDSPYFYLGVMAVAIIIFGFSFWQVQHTIKAPFALESDSQSNADNQQQALAEADIEQMKKMDSDQDGLSDYLEQYVYGTSRYIQDTDSDGTSDMQEVLAGTDPTCAEGSGNCGQNITDLAPDSSIDTNLDGTGDTDIESIKQNLLELGVTQEEIDGLSDSQLRELYNQTLNFFSSAENMTQEEILSLLSPEDIQNIPAEEIRALLIENGASEEDLSQVSDEELKQIFQQAIQENTSQ